MYECESWTIKKAECQRIDAFEPWCWRGLLRVPWIVRRSNQPILRNSVLNVHWKDWCWSWNSNPLATWCKELTHCKRPWYWERWKAGGGGNDRQWDGWMASPTRWTWVWASSKSWWYQGSLACCGPWGHRESDTTEGLNWSQFLSAVYGRGLLFLLTYTDALECWGSTQWILVEWMNKYIRFTFGPSVLVLWQHLAWYF